MTSRHICQEKICHNVLIAVKSIEVSAMKNNLRTLRKSRGYTQIALQMKTGIEQSLLSKFESGERTPPTDTLVRLAEFYDVSLDYILCRTENPRSHK